MKNAFIIAVSLLAVTASAASAGEVKVQATAGTGEKTNAPPEQTTSAEIKARSNSPSQSEFENNTSNGPTLLDRTGTDDRPSASYRFGMDLPASKTNIVIQSKQFPKVQYSGMAVQTLKNNPLQLINPFAPAKYGNGEMNIVRYPVTTQQPAGFKLFQISF